MPEWVSLNGDIVPAEAARVSVFDSGFTQGVGLFETMRAEHGVALRLPQHVQRLVNSAQQLGWGTVPVEERLELDVERLLAAIGDPGEPLRVRLTVTTGAARVGAPDEPELTIVVTAAVGADYPAELYTKGATVALAEAWQNDTDPLTGHKTTSYFSRLDSLRRAHRAGALEALWFTPDKRLAEGAISNVFVFHDEALKTPPLDTPVLPGITRAIVLELARRLNIPVAETPLTIHEVLGAQEILLTNSLMGVLPVVRIERERVGEEKPGPVAAELREAYQLLVQEECRHDEDAWP